MKDETVASTGSYVHSAETRAWADGYIEGWQECWKKHVACTKGNR